MAEKKAADHSVPEIKIPEKNAASLAIQQKKFSHLKKKIIFGLVTVFLLISIISLILYYYFNLQKTTNAEISKLTNYVASLKNKTVNIESKVNDAKKYKAIWKSISENRKNFNGINTNEINNIFSNLSQKYKIINPSIQISVPELLKDPAYNRPTLDVFLSSNSISFTALTDVMALYFVKDFIDSLPGYIVITDFTIKKTLEAGYNEQELLNISLGNPNGAINSKLSFSWYLLKKKNPGTKIIK